MRECLPFDPGIVDPGAAIRFSPSMFGLLSAACLLASVSNSGLYVVYGCLVIYAMRGTFQALQALTISWLLLYLSPVFSDALGLASNMRWLVLAIAWVVVIKEYRKLRIRDIDALKRLGLFAFVIIFLAAKWSVIPKISILKAIQFTVGAVVVICSAYVVAFRKHDVEKWYYNLFLFITLASMFLYPTSLGFLKNQRGFQGILNHPQALGVFLAPMLAWLIGTHFVMQRKSPFLPFAIILGCFGLYASQARTGLVAIALACVVTYCCFQVFRRRQLHSLRGVRLSAKGIIAGLTVVTAMVVFVPAVRNQVMLFIVKQGATTSIEEGFQLSRGFLIERSFDNFYSFPLTGMGFGTPSNLDLLEAKTNQATGMFSSAPTEKGFLPSAILEETGIVGTLFFCLFFGSLSYPIVKYAPVQFVLIFFTAVFVNFGEMIFFSFGGIGLYTWLLIGMSLSSAIKVILAEYALYCIGRREDVAAA